MTSAVLYGTTSDNELRPVQVTDSGEFVTDGGGGGDWYENFYVGGSEGDPFISLLSDGSISADGGASFGGGVFDISSSGVTTVAETIRVNRSGEYQSAFSAQQDGADKINLMAGGSASFQGDITTTGSVYAKAFIDTDGYDLSKIGQALSTIHDVLDSVDDLHGLKNVLHHLLDNLKSDPAPPPPDPEPPE